MLLTQSFSACDTYVTDNLSLHQSVCRRTKAMNVALHGKLEVVSSSLPVLESVLDRVMRVC